MGQVGVTQLRQHFPFTPAHGIEYYDLIPYRVDAVFRDSDRRVTVNYGWSLLGQ